MATVFYEKNSARQTLNLMLFVDVGYVSQAEQDRITQENNSPLKKTEDVKHGS